MLGIRTKYIASVAFLAFVMAPSLAWAKWTVTFVPNETDHVDVTIDGKFWHTWRSKEGKVTLEIPADSVNNKKIHILAVGQESKNATILVAWNGKVLKKMDFDGKDGENHDVEHD
jgi:phage-related protein